MDFVKSSGNEKLWKEKLKQLQRDGITFSPSEAAPEQAKKDHEKRLREFAARGKQIAIAKSITPIQSSEPVNENASRKRISDSDTTLATTTETKQNLTPNAPLGSAGEKPMIQSTEQRNENTKFNGIRGIETLTKSEPKRIVESETRSSESKQQLTLVKEVISTHMSYIDRSAELIMQRMEQLNKSNYDTQETEVIRQPSMVAIDQTIQLARVMNELMRTKKDALKTIHDIVNT
jgi:hypothetical protein